jgi:hypothetical protein
MDHHPRGLINDNTVPIFIDDVEEHIFGPQLRFYTRNSANFD